ncbi:MAG: hypothetical protein JOZ70_03705 [Pseudolabrys sp.]|nr:hypothetical protein [Pseudolabrys sp.]
MAKLAGFLGRKSAPILKAVETSAPPAATPEPEVDLDEDLFAALGIQLGGDNEALRNLLLNANHKIGELDAIKDAVGKLVDPVSKALREFETEKSEKVALQTILANTRAAYGKMRNELGEAEKKAASLEGECQQLKRDLTLAQTTARNLESTRAELAIDIAARKAQIVELESRLTQESSEVKLLREEHRRHGERALATDKRIVALESDLNGARQKLVMAEDEKRALQGALDRTNSESSRLARRLAETEASLAATQGRLRNVEANYSELTSERARLAATLDEINERHSNELSAQQMRFEAMAARANASERLLNEAREHLTSRADEIRAFDRRMTETTRERDALASKVAAMEAARIQTESELKESEQARALLLERGSALAKAFNTKEALLARNEEASQLIKDRLVAMEAQAQKEKEAAERRVEELEAALRREKLERAVVEGALEAGRKDFARLMREVMALQRQKDAEEPAPQRRAANAA